MKRSLGLVLLLATISALAAGCYVRDRGAVVVHDEPRRYDEPREHHDEHREERHEERHEEHHDDHHEDHGH